MRNSTNSYFDGGLLEYIVLTIIGGLITAFTLGIAYPWAVCLLYKWKINHTVVEGRRLQFTGSAVNLFGNWIKWFALTVITLGIYGFWVWIKVEDWKTRHITFAN